MTPKPHGSASTGPTYIPVKLEPTGILSIEIWNYYSGGLRNAWRDGNRARLEEQLPKCIAGMMRIALRERAQRDAREKDKQARRKRIDEVEQEMRRIEEEERKIKTLEQEAVAWQQAQRIREYIAAVEEDAAKEQIQPRKQNSLNGRTGLRDKPIGWIH